MENSIAILSTGNVKKLSSLLPSIIASSHSLSDYIVKTKRLKANYKNARGRADKTNHSHLFKIDKEVVLMEMEKWKWV